MTRRALQQQALDKFDAMRAALDLGTEPTPGAAPDPGARRRATSRRSAAANQRTGQKPSQQAIVSPAKPVLSFSEIRSADTRRRTFPRPSAEGEDPGLVDRDWTATRILPDMNLRSFKMQRLFVLSIALSSGAVCAAEQSPPPPPSAVIRLWDGPAPGAPETAIEEVTGSDGRVRNVSVPTLTPICPTRHGRRELPSSCAQVGDTDSWQCEKHGDTAAAAFLPHGIAVFSLKYRLRPISKDVVADATADGERAVRLVRARAKEWNLDPQRIGIIGYSAGANLILNLLLNFDDGTPASTDAIERQSSRPDFAGLFSAWPGNQKLTAFHFSKKTPPVYIAHTEDDTTARVEFARGIEAELKKADAPVQAEYFPKGGHTAFTIGAGEHGDWPQRFLPWLTEIKMAR